jgi:hypothetical protein
VGDGPVLVASPRTIPPFLAPDGEHLQLLSHSRSSRLPWLRRRAPATGEAALDCRRQGHPPPRSARAERRDRRVHHSDAWGRVCRAPQGCCSAPCAISRPRPPCSCRSMKKQMAVTTFTVHSLRIHGCTELSDVDTRDNLSFQPKKAINTDYLGSVDQKLQGIITILFLVMPTLNKSSDACQEHPLAPAIIALPCRCILLVRSISTSVHKALSLAAAACIYVFLHSNKSSRNDSNDCKLQR